MQHDKPVAIDLFCGAGGMSLGVGQAGFHVLGAFDIDPISVSTYNRNLPGEAAHVTDLAGASAEDLTGLLGGVPADVDLLFGGPPCQGFSVMGRRSSADPRNGLLAHFGRLVAELRPRYYLVENVDGLLQHHGRQALQRFRRDVARAGYGGGEPVVLNAADFGVPQTRRRTFILGYRADSAPCSLEEHGPRDAKLRTTTVWDALSDLPVVESLPHLLDDDVYEGPLGKPSAYARSLRGKPLRRSAGAREARYRLTGCQSTLHTPETVMRFSRVPEGGRDPVSRFARLRRDGTAPTARAGSGPDHGSHTAARPIHPVAHRVITVREAARLHGFPDSFTFARAKWHALRQIGNSVPPPLARAVASAVSAACAR